MGGRHFRLSAPIFRSAKGFPLLSGARRFLLSVSLGKEKDSCKRKGRGIPLPVATDMFISKFYFYSLSNRSVDAVDVLCLKVVV